MSSDSSNNVRKYFESESNTNKLESVQEDSNSEGQSTKGQNDNKLQKRNKSIQKEPNDGKIEEEGDDDKEINNSKDNNENDNNNNNNEENENEENENENEKGNKENKNENEEEEEEEKDKEKEEEERKKEEEKINYMEIYKKLNEEYEIEHKNFGDKIKQLQIDLYSKSENLKKLTIRNHYLTINLKELNEKVDQMIKNSANKKFKILKL